MKSGFLKKQYTVTQKLTISGVVMAMYLVVMYLTQNFAFGQYQIRIATSIYALTAIFPFLILPMGLSNMLSNILMGSLGLPDMIGGFFVGILTSYAVYMIKKNNLNDWLISIPIILFPGLIVPIWLSFLLKIPYYLLAISVTVGQIIPGIVGVILVKQLRSKI